MSKCQIDNTTLPIFTFGIKLLDIFGGNTGHNCIKLSCGSGNCYGKKEWKSKDLYWFWKVINSCKITKGFLFRFSSFWLLFTSRNQYAHQKANDENYYKDITNIQNRCQRLSVDKKPYQQRPNKINFIIFRYCIQMRGK